MKWRWPWVREPQKEHIPSGAAVEEEKQSMLRDLGQVKNINRHVLARAIASSRITPEQAEAIEAIQMDKPGGKVDGTDPPAH